MKIPLSTAELAKELRTQLSALRLLSEQFDKGNEFLYKEIAVKLRIIFHQTGKSHSLYNSLNLTGNYLYNSAGNIRNLATTGCKAPIYLKFSSQAPTKFHPELLQIFNKVSFDDWWNNLPIIIDRYGNDFKRNKIILSVANTDGGAHVDISIDEEYYNITRGEGSGWSSKNLDGSVDNLNPVPSLVRQIAHETLETFEEISL